jgi:hypothetical protein
MSISAFRVQLTSISIFIGPTWPVENGAVTGPLLAVSEYAVSVIRKMQTDNIKSWAPKQDITDQFNDHAQEWIKYLTSLIFNIPLTNFITQAYCMERRLPILVQK